MAYEIAAVAGIGLLFTLAIVKFGESFAKLLVPLAIIFGILIASGI